MSLSIGISHESRPIPHLGGVEGERGRGNFPPQKSGCSKGSATARKEV